MNFDGVIHLGDVLGILVFVFTIFSFHASNVKRIRSMDLKMEQRATQVETKLDVIYSWFTTHVIGKDLR